MHRFSSPRQGAPFLSRGRFRRMSPMLWTRIWWASDFVRCQSKSDNSSKSSAEKWFLRPWTRTNLRMKYAHDGPLGIRIQCRYVRYVIDAAQYNMILCVLTLILRAVTLLRTVYAACWSILARKATEFCPNAVIARTNFLTAHLLLAMPLQPEMRFSVVFF